MRTCDGNPRDFAWIRANSSFEDIAKNWAIKQHDQAIWFDEKKTGKKVAGAIRNPRK